MEAEELLKKRFRELGEKCYQNNQYTFTGFLSPADLSCFYEIERELSYVPYTIWGGSELCERVMIRFGSEDTLGYVEEFPISCIQIRPLSLKFADELTHRDFLGALMNLGIERSTLGDILLIENAAFLFCMESMAEFIIELKVIMMLTKAVPTAEQDERIRELLSFVGLESSGKKSVRSFSFGMKQRLALAQAMITKPVLLILDEPFVGLDPIGMEDVLTRWNISQSR